MLWIRVGRARDWYCKRILFKLIECKLFFCSLYKLWIHCSRGQRVGFTLLIRCCVIFMCCYFMCVDLIWLLLHYFNWLLWMFFIVLQFTLTIITMVPLLTLSLNLRLVIYCVITTCIYFVRHLETKYAPELINYICKGVE